MALVDALQEAVAEGSEQFGDLVAEVKAERRGRLRRLGSDEHGQVIDGLLRDKHDQASAEAFFAKP